MVIDARGLGCPKPVLMAEEAVSKIQEGSVEILIDNEASLKNLQRYAKKNSLYFESEKIENYFRVKLTKGYLCEMPESETKRGEFFVITTDSLGKDESLGKMLMKGFFETINAMAVVPSSIFFINKGVGFTTEGSDSIPILKELESKGVKIYSCGTCLKHYSLEEKLMVGKVAGMAVLIDGLRDSDKVIWI